MADTVIGARLQADDQISPKVKNIKAELKAAQQEVIHLTEKFGATSKEAANAAAKTAELKNRIQDANKLVEAFNPDTKFRAFGASIQTVVGGFTALTGAMGLLGVQSEEVQKTLLKVQSALAISQGVAQLQEGIKSFQNLALVVKSALGPMGLIVTAIAAVAAGLALWFNRSKDVTAAQKALNDTTKDYEKAAAGAIENVNKVKVAFDLAKTGVISKEAALKTYNDTLGDSFGKTNDLAAAEKLLTDKADDYIKITGLKAQANALFALAAQKSAEALVEQATEGEKKITGLAKAFGETIDSATEKRKAKLVSDANEIQTLGADILRQAAEIEKKSGITTTKTEAGKPKADLKKEENDKILQHETDFQAIFNAIQADALRKRLEEQKVITDAAAAQELIDRQLMDEQLRALDTTATDVELALSGLRIRQAEDEAAEKIANEQRVYENRRVVAEASVGLLNAVADLVGRQTAAGKTLAIAAATINTFLGATEVLRAKSVLPEPIGTIVKIASVAAIVASGISAVKKIVSTPVPGGGGGGSIPSFSGLAVAAPLSPQRPQSATTALDQNSLNAIGSATTRSFVLEADITNNQEKIKRLNRAARI